MFSPSFLKTLDLKDATSGDGPSISKRNAPGVTKKIVAGVSKKEGLGPPATRKRKRSAQQNAGGDDREEESAPTALPSVLSLKPPDISKNKKFSPRKAAASRPKAKLLRGKAGKSPTKKLPARNKHVVVRRPVKANLKAVVVDEEAVGNRTTLADMSDRFLQRTFRLLGFHEQYKFRRTCTRWRNLLTSEDFLKDGNIYVSNQDVVSSPGKSLSLRSLRICLQEGGSRINHVQLYIEKIDLTRYLKEDSLEEREIRKNNYANATVKLLTELADYNNLPRLNWVTVANLVLPITIIRKSLEIPWNYLSDLLLKNVRFTDAQEFLLPKTYSIKAYLQRTLPPREPYGGKNYFKNDNVIHITEVEVWKRSTSNTPVEDHITFLLRMANKYNTPLSEAELDELQRRMILYRNGADMRKFLGGLILRFENCEDCGAETADCDLDQIDYATLKPAVQRLLYWADKFGTAKTGRYRELVEKGTEYDYDESKKKKEVKKKKPKPGAVLTKNKKETKTKTISKAFVRRKNGLQTRAKVAMKSKKKT